MVQPIGSVVLAGGGTAGHVNPLLAVADELTSRGAGPIAALGVAGGLEDDLVPARGYPLHHVPKVPMPRRPSGAWFSLASRLRAAVDAAGAVIDEMQACAVVGFGGYVSTPAYIAAHRREVPIIIHEQNARPGLANRMGARWATRVGLTFPGTQLRGGRLTGLPLRREIAELVVARATNPIETRHRAAAGLGLDPGRVTVVVTGGSLGAASINRAVAGAGATLLDAGAQVLHLTGKGKDASVREATADLGPRYVVREYLTQMHLAYGAADLVVCRSGAGTVCELTALGIPAIYVPLPIGNGEQRLNAGPVTQAAGGILVDDASFTTDWAREQLPPLVLDGARRVRMAKAAASVGITDGAARVADLVAEAVATR